jgi:hypothetical protein
MRAILSRSKIVTTWQLFAVTLALIFVAGRLLGDEPTKFVIFDNAFYGPGSSDLQATALLLNRVDPNRASHTLKILRVLRFPPVLRAMSPLLDCRCQPFDPALEISSLFDRQ